MARKKKAGYTARVKRQGVVEIDYSGEKHTLTKGDEVIVVQPTGALVRSRLTGKVLGNRESVIGRGVVDVNNADMVEIQLHPNAETSKMKMVNGTVNLIVKKVHSD